MLVSVWQTTDAEYPKTPPFHPSTSYPEAMFPEVWLEPNAAYDGVRQLFKLHGLDQANYGKKSWNPLGDIVKRGNTVLVKPNLIKENHPRDPNGWIYMMTHGSVIRAVCDYAIKAIGAKGKIIVADAPQTDSSFAEICRILNLRELQEFYRSKGIDFELVDLRKYEWDSVDDVVVSRRDLAGDPNGYVKFDLGQDSLFHGYSGEGHYYGADYDTKEINSHHYGSTHEYVISGSAIKCDVFINLPKLKTHKKAGVTLSLKNLVGINGDKNFLPHYTEGTPSTGGDQFPDGTLGHRVESVGLKAFRRVALAVPGVGPWAYRQAKSIGQRVLGATSEVIRSGNWHGNDTTWRMCLDLNRILMYGNETGSFSKDVPGSRKKYISIIDGIVGGDGDGPIDVDPVPSGVLLFGTDPVCVDSVAVAIMGLDPEKLAVVRGGFRLESFKITDDSFDTIEVVSNNKSWCRAYREIDHSTVLHFRPHFGWRGNIELDRDHVGHGHK